MKRLLLTGVTGFVGTYLYDHYDIFRVVVRSTEKSNFEKYNDVFKINNLDGSTNWDGAFLNIDTIVHLAGLAHSSSSLPEEFDWVNTHGTIRFARAAALSGVKRFVFVSSIGVNGTHTKGKPFLISDPTRPHNEYAMSKYNAEVGLKKIAEETGLEVVIVRPTLVYGYNAPGNFGMLTKIVRKLPILPFGLTNNRRDFIAVQNLADLLVACAEHPDAAGNTFLASDGDTISIKQFTNAIAKGLGKKLYQLPVPVSLLRLAARLVGKSAMVEQLLCDLQVDSSNAFEVLGWRPPYTIEQAMASLNPKNNLENKKL